MTNDDAQTHVIGIPKLCQFSASVFLSVLHPNFMEYTSFYLFYGVRYIFFEFTYCCKSYLPYLDSNPKNVLY